MIVRFVHALSIWNKILKSYCVKLNVSEFFLQGLVTRDHLIYFIHCGTKVTGKSKNFSEELFIQKYDQELKKPLSKHVYVANSLF